MTDRVDAKARFEPGHKRHQDKSTARPGGMQPSSTTPIRSRTRIVTLIPTEPNQFIDTLQFGI
jgi:hypothetical protein